MSSLGTVVSRQTVITTNWLQAINDFYYTGAASPTVEYAFAKILVDQEPSGAHFTQNGAKIQRFGDRIFLGGATLNDGAFPNVGRDWLTDFQVAAGLSSGTVASAQFVTLNHGTTSETAAVGIVAGIQSRYFGSAGTAAIGSSAYVVNNHETLSTNAWAFYAEAHKTTAAAGSTYGLELDTRSLVPTIDPTPYQQGDVVTLQLASGCELSATGQYDASAAVQVAANPKRYKVGINFAATSLVGTDGVTGTGIAAALAKGHTLLWYTPGGNAGASLTSQVTDATKKIGLTFTDAGLQLANSTGDALAYFPPIASAANYLTLAAASSGNAASIRAAGSDASGDLILSGYGSGLVRFGTYVAGAVAQAGYVLFKDDATGTTYKLLVGV